MRGTSLILLVFLLTGLFHFSRWSLSEKEELPAVLRLQSELSTIAVTDSRGSYGLYQFYDGIVLTDVIKLTEGVSGDIKLPGSLRGQAAISGEVIKTTRIEGDFLQIERSNLSARHRILLGIPLHPDRMNLFDWEALPGIGSKLAQAIENDRQKNGDFESFTALSRVKGVGPKKLSTWREYFENKNIQKKYK